MPLGDELQFFLDEGVPDSVAIAIRAAGHNASLLRERTVVRGSPDTIVCAYAEQIGAILVALDGDMKQLAKGYGMGSGRFKKLNLLKLSCAEPVAAARITRAMSLIEHEWAVGEGFQRRLYVEIGAGFIKSNR